MTDDEELDPDALVAAVRDAARLADAIPDPNARALDRAQAAVSEKGAVVVEVWCGHCDDGSENLGIVRRSSEGFVFEGRDELSMDPAVESMRFENARKWFGRRVPDVGQAWTYALLTDPDNARAYWWPPRVTCVQHGSAVADPNELLRAARLGLRRGRPEKVVVLPLGRTAR